MKNGSPLARRVILEWAEQGAVPPEHIDRALALTGVTPGASEWRRFISALLFWLGALLFAAGVIFFFAYNWDALGRFAKFGLVEALLAASIVAAAVAGPDKTAGKAALLLASMLTGALLALIGQTYQTGADTFELFAWWAVLILPWAIAARTPAVWLLIVLLVNLAVAFYFTAFRRFLFFGGNDESLVWALAVLNAVILIAWEFGTWFGPQWMQERWPRRIISVASGTTVTVLAVWGLFESREVGQLSIPAYAAWLVAAYAFYRHFSRDLFVLAGGVLSVIVFVTALLGKTLLDHAEAGGFLIIGVAVIGMSAAGAMWLRSVAAEDAEGGAE
ncbi:MAG TPA: DUF2157 domain-containing protein [Vicinamibacterales bacterium]|nr:DUF2157 domain-containing protein [Vicinamibacterales bacterium]